LEFVTVGDPGNAADTSNGGHGSVPYVYQMGKYDVTVGQYCQFLNAVAKTDAYGLYNSGMATDMPTIKIAQSGSSGNYTYTVTGGCSQAANCPIFDVTWGDAARFCNWLQNGQPTGVEGTGTTETGAYTLNGNATNWMAVTRNSTATYVIPSENEWYKAAYYKGGGTNAGYWGYTTQSSTVPINILSTTGTNNANYLIVNGWIYTDPTNYLTPVGAFSASPGPYGTYDMGGNVFQWNEADFFSSTRRGMRGGGFDAYSTYLASFDWFANDPMSVGSDVGFRVASVPEPGSLSLLIGAAIIGLLWWRRHV
ncbi:MAG: SUMF1/EgtB/PvdO family nonheme iron enzyme, partial [Thermoguttaceae bacterium]